MERKSEIILRAVNLHKAFYRPAKVHILKGVDLSVRQGETIAITGRSGQGKSTLLQILGTLEEPCSGLLEIAGRQVSSFNKTLIRNRHVAFVFQSFHLLDDYTALDNVLMPARIARQNVAKGSAAYSRGQELLHQVGLDERVLFNTKLLSGGEKQRVAIARALCNDPDIIFADEPSGNLDRQTAASIHALLLDFARKGNKSVVIVTHDQDLARMCGTQYIIENGCITRK